MEFKIKSIKSKYFCADYEFSNHHEDIDSQMDCNEVLSNSQNVIKHEMGEVQSQEVTYKKMHI